MNGKRLDFADQLRRAIERAGKSRYRLAKETGVSEAVLSRFMHGKVGLSIESVGLICKNLGLRLTPEEKPRKQKRG